MPKKDSIYLEAVNLFSKFVAQEEDFLRLTACLNPEEREIIGYCKAYKIFSGKTPFTEFLEKKVIPAFVIIGMSRWDRSELSDLGFKIADSDSVSMSLKNLFKKGSSIGK